MNNIQKTDVQENQFIEELKQIVNSARKLAYSAINFAQVEENWLIGQRIVMQEQNGKQRAEYGKRIIGLASQALTSEFGKGFSERTLRQFRQFYCMFPELPIQRTLFAISDSTKETDSQVVENEENANLANIVRQISQHSFHLLSWSHIQRIMRVQNEDARSWYLKESAEQSWVPPFCTATNNFLPQNTNFICQPKKNCEQKLHDKKRFLCCNMQGKEGIMGEVLIMDNMNIYKGNTINTTIMARKNKVMRLMFTLNLLLLRLFCRLNEAEMRFCNTSVIGQALPDQLQNSKYKLYLPTEEELRAEIARQKEIFMLQHAGDEHILFTNLK